MKQTPSIPDWGSRSFIMGILNITPDSFSGDGLLNQDDLITKAVDQAIEFVKAGVDILDIGGESTRPGAEIIDAKEEIKRIVPIIEAISAEIQDTIISVDTYKSPVAESAIKAGAHWVNDVWGLRADPEMARFLSKINVPVIIMHNRSDPANVITAKSLGGRYTNIQYDDLVADIINDLTISIEIAHKGGILDRNIIIDPGLGFGKTVAQNLELMNNLGKLKSLGYPILVGPSRKSFIGYTLNKPPDERKFGTAAAVSVCIQKGADIVRVHDVEEMIQVARMTDAIVRL